MPCAQTEELGAIAPTALALRACSSEADQQGMWSDNGDSSNSFNYTAGGDAGCLVFRETLRHVPEPTTALNEYKTRID